MCCASTVIPPVSTECLLQELALLKDGAARFLGQNARSVEGDTDDLTGARVITTMVVNGVPRTAIEVVEGVRKFRWAEYRWCAAARFFD